MTPFNAKPTNKLFKLDGTVFDLNGFLFFVRYYERTQCEEVNPQVFVRCEDKRTSQRKVKVSKSCIGTNLNKIWMFCSCCNFYRGVISK